MSGEEPMVQQAILHLRGTVATGCQVTLNIRDDQGNDITEASGSLPPAPELVQSLAQWQESYRQVVTTSRLGPIEGTVEPGTLAKKESCRLLGKCLEAQFANWLATAAGFVPIDKRLLESFTRQDNIRVVVRSDELLIHRLPWHCWDFVKRYPLTEVIFGSAPQQAIAPGRLPPTGQSKVTGPVRILAILGDRQNIDTDVDRQLLAALPQADVTFLVEPSRKEMDAQLWEKSWDILFFAGHSSSELHQGTIHLRPDESLTIEELRYGLQNAIRQGLQLAIFNSCDGLGLAYELKSLDFPQLIVMREPVADRVAQDFLKYFLTVFSRGESLHLALREARERLQSLEDKFLWATWLPVLFHNPAAIASTWQSLQERPVGRSRRQSWLRAVALGAGLALGLVAVRYWGGMQALELTMFDHLTRSRPSEQEDDRIVVIEVTDADIAAQPESEREAGRSISNQTLDQAFKILDSYEPAVIGLDIYRDLPSTIPSLAAQFANNEKLIAVCKGRDSIRGIKGVAPPPGVPSERLGLSDTLDDVDGVVRRHLLASQPHPDSPCMTDYSLSAALTYSHLAAQGINLTFPNTETWQWDQTQFRRIGAAPWLNINLTNARYGPYAPLNAQGHQLLLNYRVYQPEPGQPKHPAQAFLQVPLADLLGERLNPNSLKDKIVLLGVNASSSDDVWLTPYRSAAGEPLEIPGVYIQAQMTSQLLSAVLDGRSLLYCLPWLVEGIVMVGLGVAAAAGGRGRWGWVSLVVIPLGFYGMGWFFFVRMGLLLPLLPWSFAWIVGGLGGSLDRRLSHS